MEVGKCGFSQRDLQRFYPQMYRKLYEPTKKIAKKKGKEARAAVPLNPGKVALEPGRAPARPEKPATRMVKGARAKLTPKAAKKIADKVVKKGERIEKNNSKLLEQLTFLNQRIETMERDKELYALVDANLTDEGVYTFTVIRIGEDTPLHLKVNEKFETSCSCMDWNIRCRGLSVPCKHIYYLLVKMLTYELFDYYDNQIMDPENFKYLVKRRINFGDVRFDAGRLEELGDELCPICFVNLGGKTAAEELLRCPDCHKVAHKDCVNVWMQHSPKRNCVYCRSEKWNMYFGGRK